MPIRRKVFVRGHIQEASYIADTARIADELKVNGWVRNHGDGSVEACFEGRRRDVEAIVSWCFIGPKRAEVDEVVVRKRFYRGTLSGFRILQDNQAAYFRQARPFSGCK